jgi:hypothetical protein
MKLQSTTSLGGLLLALTATLASGAVYTQSFTAADGTTGAGLGDGSSINGGNATGYVAAVRGNQLELSNAANDSTNSSFNIPALAGSSLGFTVTFDLTLTDTAGGNPPADGFSFSYGNTFNSTTIFGAGEEGPGGTNSITWVVDTWDNGTSDRGIRTKVNGTNDFVQNFIPLADGATVAGPVSLAWSPTDGMSMTFAGTPVFTNRAITGFTGGDDYLFGFGARTGGATETVWIDNLNITSVPEPTLVSFLGLGGLLAIVRRRR